MCRTRRLLAVNSTQRQKVAARGQHHTKYHKISIEKLRYLFTLRHQKNKILYAWSRTHSRSHSGITLSLSLTSSRALPSPCGQHSLTHIFSIKATNFIRSEILKPARNARPRKNRRKSIFSHAQTCSLGSASSYSRLLPVSSFPRKSPKRELVEKDCGQRQVKYSGVSFALKIDQYTLRKAPTKDYHYANERMYAYIYTCTYTYTCVCAYAYM